MKGPMLANLQRRDRVALMVGAVAVGLFLVVQFGVFPMLNRLPQTQGDLEGREVTLRRYQRLVRESALEQVKLITARDRLTGLELGLFEGPSPSLANAAWQRLVRELADSRGIELVSSELLQTQDLASKYSLVVGRIQLRCRLDQLVDFLVALANSPKLMSVTRMRMWAMQGDEKKRLNVELTIGAPVLTAKLAEGARGQKK
jgi:hypothetical protein